MAEPDWWSYQFNYTLQPNLPPQPRETPRRREYEPYRYRSSRSSYTGDDMLDTAVVLGIGALLF